MDVMQLRRNLLMQKVGGLPDAYQQIEYLEGTGTQYILTDYIAPAGVAAEWDYYITKAFSGDKMMWGARDSTNAGRCFAELYGSTKWYCGNGYSRYSGVLTGVGASVQTKYHASMDSTAFTINGTSVSPTDNTYTAPSIKISIFAYNTLSGVQWIHDALRLYGLKFTNNGAVEANFVPCIRKSDSEPGMYDTVSGTFYTNAGTGTFLIPS